MNFQEKTTEFSFDSFAVINIQLFVCRVTRNYVDQSLKRVKNLGRVGFMLCSMPRKIPKQREGD